MKALLTILKYVSFLALVVAMVFGYLFFSTWQKNERPVITESSWDQNEILLGHSSTLSLTVKAPWHRELESARPFSFPKFLAPVPRLGTVEKGPLDFTGHRTWKITIPFVATDTEVAETPVATFPIKKLKRISPSSINVELPPITVLSPSDLPDEPANPETFLTEDRSPDLDPIAATPPPSRLWWPWVVGGLILLGLLFVLLRRTGIIKTTPAWEKALGRLDSLPIDTPPGVFFSKLTDILKAYTSDRYLVRARAKTSSEFIRTLQELPSIPNEYLTDLPAFARLADGVKFADEIPPEGEASRALELVRSFVKATIPVETTPSTNE